MHSRSCYGLNKSMILCINLSNQPNLFLELQDALYCMWHTVKAAFLKIKQRLEASTSWDLVSLFEALSQLIVMT